MASKRIKRKRRPGLAGPRYWAAVGTMVAYSAAGSGKLALAQEQGKGRSASYRDGERIQSLPARRYQIAAGTLETVVPELEKTAGIRIEISDAGLLRLNSSGVSGVMTLEEALKKALADTGLSYSFRSPNLIRLQIREARATVDVVDSVPVVASSLPKYQGSLQDTPQTISVVSQQTMQQQGNTTVRDALRNVSGISLAAGEGGSQGDNLTIRGFTARNDLFIDGMRDFGSYYRDPFNTQEVEVLQGPSSVTFGRGSTGGVVNQASKTPGLQHFISGGLMGGTDGTRRANVDINIPIPQLGSGAAFRLNAMGNINGVAARDVAKYRRDGIAPSLSLGLGTATRITLSYFHQNEDDTPDYGLPWLFNQPAAVKRSNYYGLENGNYLRAYDDIGTAKVEHDVNTKVTVRNQFRYANYARNVLVTEPQLNNVTTSTPLSAMQVTRRQISANSTETFLDDQLDLIAHVETGPLKHTLVAGVEGGREASNPTRYNYTAPGTSLLNPQPTDTFAVGPTVASRVTDSAVTAGAYVLDTVAIGPKIEITGGIRYDRFDNTYGQTVVPASNFQRTDQKPTWRGAIVYKPTSNGSIYFDAGTSFNPSAETLSLSAGTANLPPETNKNFEVGTKWSFRQGRFTLNNSWFRTTKDNAREVSPTNSLLNVLAGRQRVDGTQLDVRGRISSRWDVLGSYAYLDSRVVASPFYPGAIGYPLANVPRNTFNLWNNYHLPKRFELGLGANYESSRNASSTVPLDPTTKLVKQVPGYWVFNAMVSHPLNEHVDLQANIYNLANRYYYDLVHPAHVVPGAGRSALIGFKFKF